MKKQKRLALKNRTAMYGYLFVLPVVIGIIFIFLPNLILSIRYAFSEVVIGFGNVKIDFVGWANFKRAFLEDVEYRQILINTVKGAIVDTIIILSFSFFVATLLNQEFKGRSLARTIMFMPIVLSTGVILSVDNAITTTMVETVGEEVSVFASYFDLERLLLSFNLPSGITSVIVYAVDSTYSILSRSGVQIMIFLSALQGISPSVFEAAKMEGASKWEEFWKITFPMITPMILVGAIYTIVDSFVQPSYGMMQYVKNYMFNKNDMGYASAVAWVYFVFILIVLMCLFKLTSKRVEYTNS